MIPIAKNTVPKIMCTILTSKITLRKKKTSIQRGELAEKYKTLRGNLLGSIAKSAAPGRKIRVLTAESAVQTSESAIPTAKNKLATTKRAFLTVKLTLRDSAWTD